MKLSINEEDLFRLFLTQNARITLTGRTVYDSSNTQDT